MILKSLLVAVCVCETTVSGQVLYLYTWLLFVFINVVVGLTANNS